MKVPIDETVNGYRARHQYEGVAAESYDADRQRTLYDRIRWNRERDRLTATLRRIAPHGCVLDIPTGTGRLLGAMSSLACQAIGADISMDMLRLAMPAQSKPLLVQAEAERLPFSDRTFDLVISIRFFQHLPEAVVIPVLSEMMRVSRRGALIQAPVTKPTSALIKVAVDTSRWALHRGSSPRPPRRVPRPENRYFPRRVSDFESLLRSHGMGLASSEFVTWPGGQLTLMHIVEC